MRIEGSNNAVSIQAPCNDGIDSVKPIRDDISIKTKSQTTRNEIASYRELSRKEEHELSIDESAWVEMVERANKAIAGAKCNFEYSIHEGTKEIMVKVINRETKEVIREIPPEKILDLVAKMWEISGILVDERR